MINFNKNEVLYFKYWNSYGTYIFAPAYVVIEKNQFCADEGKGDITEEECKTFADKEDVGFGSETDASYPKGCYQFGNGGKVYFNRHPVGSRQSNSSPICSDQGMV